MEQASSQQNKFTSRTQSLKEGYLHKRGGRIPSWHRRWFILKGDILFYYRNVNDVKPLGTIPLAGNKLIRHPDDPKLPNQYRFEISAGTTGQTITATHDSFLLYSEDADDARSWMNIISGVIYGPYGGAMFGRSLAETVELEKRFGGGGYVPFIVYKCCEYVREKGLKEVGIFRLPGSTTRVNELRDLFNEGKQIEFPTRVGEDVHTVASLLKLYIRDLPEPVIDHYNYRKVIDATKAFDIDEVNGETVLRETLEQLPKPNYNLLKYISRFLSDVQSHSNINKMVSSNLGTVFGPNLLRPESDDPHELVACANLLTRFVVIIIDANETLFAHTDDEKLPETLNFPERRSHVQALNRKTSWTSSVYDESGLERQATLQRVNKIPEHRPMSLREYSSENLISFENEDQFAVGDTSDIETMRQQIHTLNALVGKGKKAGRLWKKRYEQEKKARESAEQRVEELRFALDETFKKFDINYGNSDNDDDQLSDEVSEL